MPSDFHLGLPEVARFNEWLAANGAELVPMRATNHYHLVKARTCYGTLIGR